MPVPLLHRRGVRQFVKFCIIGFSSMIIDVGIAKYLTYSVHLNWIVAQVISFSLAVTNGFIWNSAWTFRGLGSGSRRSMYGKFVLVNVVGLILNLGIMKGCFLVFTGRLINQGTPDPFHWNIAKGLAIIVVAMWNFLANKKWTFAD
jgi:putative flippase GtrA